MNRLPTDSSGREIACTIISHQRISVHASELLGIRPVSGTWVVRGGFGIYHDWPTLGNTANGLAGNPPGFIVPTFFSGTANPPIFAFGTSNTYPFGFPYPALPATGLDSHGGLVGAHSNVVGIDPNLGASSIYVFSVTAERSLTKDWVASIGYTGQRGRDFLAASGQGNFVNNTFYAIDINQFPAI